MRIKYTCKGELQSFSHKMAGLEIKFRATLWDVAAERKSADNIEPGKF